MVTPFSLGCQGFLGLENPLGEEILPKILPMPNWRLLLLWLLRIIVCLSTAEPCWAAQQNSTDDFFTHLSMHRSLQAAKNINRALPTGSCAFLHDWTGQQGDDN